MCLFKIPCRVEYLRMNNNCLSELPFIPNSVEYLFIDNNYFKSYPESTNDHNWIRNHNKHFKRKNILKKLLNGNR